MFVLHTAQERWKIVPLKEQLRKTKSKPVHIPKGTLCYENNKNPLDRVQRPVKYCGVIKFKSTDFKNTGHARDMLSFISEYEPKLRKHSFPLMSLPRLEMTLVFQTPRSNPSPTYPFTCWTCQSSSRATENSIQLFSQAE